MQPQHENSETEFNNRSTMTVWFEKSYLFQKVWTYFKTDFQTTKSSTIFLPSQVQIVWLVKNDLMANFCHGLQNGWGEEWQFNKSKSRGHGRYQSITRQSATIWLHFRARRAGPSFCWKLTLFKNVFQVQTLWWCWWLVHSVEIMEIYSQTFVKKYFVKATLLKMLLKSWFCEMIFRWE